MRGLINPHNFELTAEDESFVQDAIEGNYWENYLEIPLNIYLDRKRTPIGLEPLPYIKVNETIGLYKIFDFKRDAFVYCLYPFQERPGKHFNKK